MQPGRGLDVEDAARGNGLELDDVCDRLIPSSSSSLETAEATSSVAVSRVSGFRQAIIIHELAEFLPFSRKVRHQFIIIIITFVYFGPLHSV